MPKKQNTEPKLIENKQRGAICGETMKPINIGETCLYYPSTHATYSKNSERFKAWDNRFIEDEDE